MGKLLFWIIVVLVALVVARIAARAAVRNAQGARPAGRRGSRRSAGSAPAGPPEQMVRCAHCGIHLPRSEATLIGGRIWCSQEHARLGAKN
ncbi:hypothetical protein CAL14_01490 [Bordetella genomosp. 9]|uniref:PP0621 family protein n=1 Tax=Bordetella genomosp. 9 TaxID=1416803 RepID=UPI000A2972BD|nr:PP0621 family protein [Bordetella genomosp. 9]ARP89132.1 hypothetical protein CAL14_01490 [Bordetella genomosp. 9]